MPDGPVNAVRGNCDGCVSGTGVILGGRYGDSAKGAMSADHLYLHDDGE